MSDSQRRAALEVEDGLKQPLEASHPWKAKDERGDKSWRTAFEAGKFVLDPHASSILPVWDSIILVMIVIISFHVPYQVAFRIDAEDAGPALVAARCIDMTFACDMLIQFFVSYPRVEDHRWVRMPKAIMEHYFYGYFSLDIISVFPYDVASKYITLEMGPRYKFLGLFKLLSLLRLGRVNRLIARYEALVNLPYTYIRLLKLLVVLSFSLHWIACAWGLLFFVETSLGIKIDSTWPQVLRGAKPGMFADPDEYGAFELYTASMYWSCMTITSIGYGDVVANNALEAWGATLIMAISGLLWANIIGSICAIAGSLDAETAEHENQLDSLNTMMRHLDLPSDLRVQLREFFTCRAGLSFRAKQYELIRALSPELKGGVARWMQSTMMKKVWFFQDVSNAFAVGLFEHFSFAMYPPREMVKISRSLIFLLSGVVMKSAKILPPGSVWGIDNLILTNAKLLQDSSVLALSYLQLQYLRQSGLAELTLDFPAERKQIRKAAAYAALRRAAASHMIQPSWLLVPIHGQSDAFRWDSDSRDSGPSKLDEAKLDEALFLLKRITSSKQVATRQNSRQGSRQKIPSR